MRFDIGSITTPDRTTWLAGLSLDELHPALREARGAVTRAKASVDAAKSKAALIVGAIAGLPAQVAAGTAESTAIHALNVDRQAAALDVAAAEGRLRAAEAAVGAAEDEGKRLLAAEVARRRGDLQAAAQKLWPVLDELRALEYQLANTTDRTTYALGVVWPPPLALAGPGPWRQEG